MHICQNMPRYYQCGLATMETSLPRFQRLPPQLHCLFHRSYGNIWKLCLMGSEITKTKSFLSESSN